jgi:hypothetical protein
MTETILQLINFLLEPGLRTASHDESISMLASPALRYLPSCLGLSRIPLGRILDRDTLEVCAWCGLSHVARSLRGIVATQLPRAINLVKKGLP